MSNPTKNQLIAQFGSSAEDALGGISGSSELTDGQLLDAMQSTLDQLSTVAPDKGKPTIKIQATGGL